MLFSNHANLKLEGFTDADWVENLDDRKSTSGYYVFVGNNLVRWRSKKQSRLQGPQQKLNLGPWPQVYVK